MSDPSEPPKTDKAEKPPVNRHQADQLTVSLRRAFQTDLTAPVPDHLQRLVDALQQRLKDSDRPKAP